MYVDATINLLHIWITNRVISLILESQVFIL